MTLQAAGFDLPALPVKSVKTPNIGEANRAKSHGFLSFATTYSAAFDAL
jgi:hypothetical protein